jgi:PAS domain S-box-containing protein
MSHPFSSGMPSSWSANLSPFWRYGIALILVAVAVLLRAGLDPVMGHPSVAVFMVAILLGAWTGGVGPALVCLVLLHFVHGYWFQTPRGLWEPNTGSIVSTIGWYVVGITVGILSQMRAAAQRRAHGQQLEAISQREQLRATLSCIANGVLVTDVHGRLTLMNPAAEALTGWNLRDAIGRQWHEVLAIRRENSQVEVESLMDLVLHQGRVKHETMPLALIARTGHTTPITYSAARVESLDGQLTGVVLVFRDESERQRTELALKNADRRKDEFLATLAHELRNPLAPICMGFDLLRLSADDPKAAKEVCAMMERQAKHMVRLIDDLLDVSRITCGKLELRKSRLELADIVHDAVAATRPLLDVADQQLTVHLPDKPLLLYADANRLTQVLMNLLNNASKYTPREGRIELVTEQIDDHVTFSVSDSGIGIPADKMDRVFDMFTQINDSNECGHKGLGIGLALVKRLVEMHGGSVDVQSRGRNLGTTFVVRLPALPDPTAKGNGALEVAQDGLGTAKRRILVVDDNTDALDSLSRLVALLGNEVRRAQDGLEAFEIARNFQPDIVLMDLGMPILNGYDAARRIRQEPWGRELVLVATTGWGQDDDRRRTAEAGFDRHLIKPITMAALREVLDASPECRAATSLPLPDAAERDVVPSMGDNVSAPGRSADQ